MLIGSGQYGSINPLYLAAEGEIIARLQKTNLINALVVLVCAYYVFNISYPYKGRNMYHFLEAVLLQNNNEARKRVTVNWLMQEMDL